MNKQTYEELIQFFENKNMTEIAKGLKKDMKGLVSTKSNKENAD